MPTARISVAEREKEPRLVLKSGFAQIRTRAPSAGGGSVASSTVRGQITRTETAATGSRRVRNTVLPRRVSSAIWPSTQTRPRRPIHSLVSLRIVRTGTGASGDVSSAMMVGSGPALVPFAELDEAAFEHGDHGRAALVGILVVEQRLDLAGVQHPQPGPQ